MVETKTGQEIKMNIEIYEQRYSAIADRLRREKWVCLEDYQKEINRIQIEELSLYCSLSHVQDELKQRGWLSPEEIQNKKGVLIEKWWTTYDLEGEVTIEDMKKIIDGVFGGKK